VSDEGESRSKARFDKKPHNEKIFTKRGTRPLGGGPETTPTKQKKKKK